MRLVTKATGSGNTGHCDIPQTRVGVPHRRYSCRKALLQVQGSGGPVQSTQHLPGSGTPGFQLGKPIFPLFQ